LKLLITIMSERGCFSRLKTGIGLGGDGAPETLSAQQQQPH